MTTKIIQGDCRDVLRTLPDESVHCVVTSPPYWGLRDYGVDGQIGLEAEYPEFVDKMVETFREVRRLLCKDGTLWLNLGDSYHSGDRGGYRNDAHRWEKSEIQRSNRGNAATIRPNRLPQPELKDKDLCGIPWRVAFALQADGWYLRQDIIWSKPNPMPESVRDRCTKAHEYVFMFSKSARYFYDADAIKEPRRDVSLHEKWKTRFEGWDRFDKSLGRNKRSVWVVAAQPFTEAHFATFPPALIEPCILAGCPKGGTVLDPFFGAGTTGLVANRLGRDCIGIELNPEYAAMAGRRIADDAGMFAQVVATARAEGKGEG